MALHEISACRSLTLGVDRSFYAQLTLALTLNWFLQGVKPEGQVYMDSWILFALLALFFISTTSLENEWRLVVLYVDPVTA